MKLKRFFAAILMAVMCICSVQVTAGAETKQLFTTNDSIAAVEFESLDDFKLFIIWYNEGKTDCKGYEGLEKWFASKRHDVYMPNDLYPQNAKVTLTPTYISLTVCMGITDEIFQIYDYYDDTGKEKYNAAKKRYESKKSGTTKKYTSTKGGDVYFENDTANEYDYYWEEDGKYFVLRVFSPDDTPEEYVYDCDDCIKINVDDRYKTIGYDIAFDSVEDLNKFLSLEKIPDLLTPRADTFGWVTTADSISIPKAYENNIGGLRTVEIDETFVTVSFETNNKKYLLSFDLDDNLKGWYDDLSEWYNNPESRARRDIQKHELNGSTVLFCSDPKSRYYFERDGVYYELYVYDDKFFSEEDLALCELVTVPLNVAQGWHTMQGNKFYREKNGKAVTKPTIIDGKLYKFAKSGICKGLYTGFASTKKGKVYYKDGVRVKNKVLKLKNGTRYKADKNGYLTKI